MSTFRWLRRLSAVAACAGAVAASAAAPATADDAVPFKDPNAIASLGFCDKSGHEVTSGHIGDAPFAWKAVSSAAAPAGYGAGTGRASLFVYQPIRYVDPGDWSGKQLTASSRFTNTAHPMAQATPVDPALVDFVSVFPSHWNGLVQLRMFFSAPDKPQVTQQYPAAVVQVKGDTWHLVAGGHPACGAGKAVSAETIALPSTVVNPAAARSTPNARPAGGHSAPASGKGAATRSGAAGGVSGSAGSVVDADGKPVADSVRSTASDSGGGSAWWIALVVVAALATGAFAWRRLRRS